MTTMSDDKSVSETWQASVADVQLPSMDLVRKGAGKLYRGVWIRNAIEYAACIFVIVSFALRVFERIHVIERIGCVVSVLGVLFVAWQLHHRASAARIETAGMMPALEFVRAQLVRQRDALAGVLWWYLLPLVPGMLLVLVGAMLRKIADGTGTILEGAIGFGVMVVLFVGVWWLNQWSAGRLQKHIDYIDELLGAQE
jgi:drug/metabolite transporter (DMT)-like permease